MCRHALDVCEILASCISEASCCLCMLKREVGGFPWFQCDWFTSQWWSILWIKRLILLSLFTQSKLNNFEFSHVTITFLSILYYINYHFLHQSHFHPLSVNWEFETIPKRSSSNSAFSSLTLLFLSLSFNIEIKSGLFIYLFICSDIDIRIGSNFKIGTVFFLIKKLK